MIDLHMHTIYSDGNNTILDMKNEAIKRNLSCIAITDHYSTSWKSGIINTLNVNNIPNYITEIKRIRRNSSIKILIGIEIDTDSYFEDIKRINFENFDIVLLEYIKDLKILKNYINYFKNKTGIFDNNQHILALAHSNIHVNISKKEFKDDFISIMSEYGIFFELNSRYLEYFISYPEYIRELVSNDINFTIGSDAHSVRRVGDVNKIYQFLEKLNGKNCLEKIHNFISNFKIIK
ncbi:MAG: CpsB/CapC family capsule biosynthesis tyrosine phosphatase [Candidatus Helarchaeota archaeon]